MVKHFEYNGEMVKVKSLGYTDYVCFAGEKRTIWETDGIYSVEFNGKTFNAWRHFVYLDGEWYEITRDDNFGYVLGSNLDNWF